MPALNIFVAKSSINTEKNWCWLLNSGYFTLYKFFWTLIGTCVVQKGDRRHLLLTTGDVSLSRPGKFCPLFKKYRAANEETWPAIIRRPKSTASACQYLSTGSQKIPGELKNLKYQELPFLWRCTSPSAFYRWMSHRKRHEDTTAQNTLLAYSDIYREI